MKYRAYLPWAIIAFTVALSVYVYPQLPERVVSHWDATGQPNGTMTRFWGAALVPLLMLGFLGIFSWLPRLDPLKQHQEANRVPAQRFLLIFMAFLAFMQGIILAWNLGMSVDLMSWLIVAMSALFFAIGRMFGQLKRNWFFGIRTPWTLSDEAIWDETHRLGAIAFQAAAFIMLCGLAVPEIAIWSILVPTIGASLYCIVVSYQLYRERHPNS